MEELSKARKDLLDAEKKSESITEKANNLLKEAELERVKVNDLLDKEKAKLEKSLEGDKKALSDREVEAKALEESLKKKELELVRREKKIKDQEGEIKSKLDDIELKEAKLKPESKKKTKK